MAKKKKYEPQKNDEWDFESDKEHRETIKKKENAIGTKYKKWWDKKKHKWKEGFDGH